MTQLERADLETILGFQSAVKSAEDEPIKVFDRRLILPLRAIQRQVDHLRLYTTTEETPEIFLTEPSGLILFARYGDMEFFGWKFPNSRAGTRDTEFVLEQSVLQYSREEYLKAQKARNPSADIPEVINTLLAVKKLQNPTDIDLFETAYHNGLYLPGEIEGLSQNVEDTRTMIDIVTNLGTHVKKHYCFSLDSEEGRRALEGVKPGNVTDRLKSYFDKRYTEKVQTDLIMIRDHDPRNSVRRQAQLLLSATNE